MFSLKGTSSEKKKKEWQKHVTVKKATLGLAYKRWILGWKVGLLLEENIRNDLNVKGIVNKMMIWWAPIDLTILTKSFVSDFRGCDMMLIAYVQVVPRDSKIYYSSPSSLPSNLIGLRLVITTSSNLIDLRLCNGFFWEANIQFVSNLPNYVDLQHIVRTKLQPSITSQREDTGLHLAVFWKVKSIS